MADAYVRFAQELGWAYTSAITQNAMSFYSSAATSISESPCNATASAARGAVACAVQRSRGAAGSGRGESGGQCGQSPPPDDPRWIQHSHDIRRLPLTCIPTAYSHNTT